LQLQNILLEVLMCFWIYFGKVTLMWCIIEPIMPL